MTELVLFLLAWLGVGSAELTVAPPAPLEWSNAAREIEERTGLKENTTFMVATRSSEFGRVEWIDLADIPNGSASLVRAGQRLIVTREFYLVVTYPVRTFAVAKVSVTGIPRVDREDLVNATLEVYQAVYQQEEATQSVPTPDINDRKEVLNRPQSDGLYQIYGHDLRDLAISAFEYFEIDGKTWIVPIMES